MKKLNKAKKQQLFVSMATAKGHIEKLNPEQKASLEKGWDIEHAYYSSVLEGSKLDREEFEELGAKIA